MASVEHNADTISELLRQARENAGLSIRAASELVGVHFSQIWKYENGQSSPRIRTLQKMAEVYKMDITPIKAQLIERLNNEFDGHGRKWVERISDDERRLIRSVRAKKTREAVQLVVSLTA
jgi:transcriptional regulator with XRE-family HTH domain